MKRHIWIIAALLSVSTAMAAAPELPPKAHPDSSAWDLLFTGDLSNADFSKGIWFVTNGTLTASEDQCIWTRKDYSDFVLDLEFNLETNANSGIVIHCTDPKKWIPNSIEIQILDDNGSKWTTAAPTWRCAGIFGHLAPAQSAVKKPGDWNRMTVTCKDKMIYVMLNGELVTTMDRSKWTDGRKNPDGSTIPNWMPTPFAKLPTKGKIGLQGKHAGASIFFRNIRIQKL